MRWSKPATNFAVDATALFVFLCLLWTRFLTFLVVPPTSTGQAWRLWGGTHADWDRLNFWLTVLFVLVILLHLILHWTWITHFIRHRLTRRQSEKTPLASGIQTIYGVAFMIGVFTVLGGLLAIAVVMAKPI